MRLFFSEYTNYTFNKNEFRIPHYLKEYFIDNLNKYFFNEEKLGSLKPNHVLGIEIIITSKIENAVMVVGPEYQKTEYNWVIQFPYHVIDRATDKNKVYTELFFDGMAKVLKHYKTDETEVYKVRDKILLEIANNPTKYQYTEQETENHNYIKERRAEYLIKGK